MAERLSSDLDNQQKFSVKDRARKLMAAALVTVTLSGPLAAEVRAETPAPADPSATQSTETTEVTKNDNMPDVEVEAETPAPADPMNGEVVYPTQDYADRMAGISECKDFIKEHEYLPNLLDFGAELMYVERNHVGFPAAKYKYEERTKIGTYIDDEDVLEWVKTGEGLPVIWHKDENGNVTNEPAMVFKTADSDYQISIEIFQEALDRLEKDCPGFLRSLCDRNDVIVFLQTDAVGGLDGGAKYGWGVEYLGYNKKTKKTNKQNDEGIIELLMKYLPVEGFGNRATVLLGDECEYNAASGVIKESLDADWNWYMYKKTKKKFYKTNAKEAEGWCKKYTKQSIYTKEELGVILKKVKDENLIPPYGVDSWAKVDEVIG